MTSLGVRHCKNVNLYNSYSHSPTINPLSVLRRCANVEVQSPRDSEQRRKIWDIYLKLFDLDADQAKPNDQQWTGAEIRACCRLAALLDLPLTTAAQNVVPVAVTAAESVERLRSWACGRCLDAESSGIYKNNTPAKPGRKLRRVDPSNN